MENTPLPGIDIAAERKRNTRIAIAIGAAGFGGFIMFYVVMFLLMILSPFTMFRMMPLPEFPKTAVGFHGKLFIFSEGVDFRNATWEQKPRDISTMREFEGGELGEPHDIEPFSTVAADENAIYFFHKGGYRTFDGTQWSEFESPAIGNRPEGVVDNGRIWLLSVVEGTPELVRIVDGVVTPVALPFEDGSIPAICRLDIVSLDGTLHLFERSNGGANHFIYTSQGWSGPERIDQVNNYRFLIQGGRLWLFSKELGGTFSERSFDGTSWSEARPLSFGTGLMGMFFRPVRYGTRRALLLNNPFQGTVYVLDDDGNVSEHFSVGGTMIRDFMLAGILWAIVPFAVIVVIVLAFSYLVNRYKLRRWPSADGKTYEFASFFRRFLAHLIDMFILLVPVYAAFFFLFDEMFSSTEPLRFIFVLMAVMMLGLIVVPFLYYSLFEGLGGKTPGKFVCGIRVLKDDFTRCGIGAAMLRTLLRVVDSFFYYLVAAVTIGATLKWQRLGDLAASTVVVMDRKAATPARSPRGVGPRRP